MCNFKVLSDNYNRSSSRMSNADLFGVFKKAAKLTKDPCNGCRTVVSQRHFALSPRYLGRLKKGAMEVLQSEIGRYSESLGGVPLAYCNLQLLQQTGNILDDQPFIHFNVSFKAVIFQPSIGSVLKCVVNELGTDHVSCLVHDWFNLSLPLRGIDAQERLPKGSKVIAKVTQIQAKNGILAIQGSPTEERFSDLPVSDPLKDETFDKKGIEAAIVDTAAPQKVKHDSGFGSDPENLAGLHLESAESTSGNDGEISKKKKKKKRRDEGKFDDVVVKLEPCDDGYEEEGVVQVIEEQAAKKKKKKKKEKKETVDDSPGMTSIKKEPDWSNDEHVYDGPDREVIVEHMLEKKEKKKRKSTFDSESLMKDTVNMKTEIYSEESTSDVIHSKKKEKKKEHKEEDLVGSSIAIKEEVNNDEYGMDSSDAILSKKKAQKKKHKNKNKSLCETDAKEAQNVDQEHNHKNLKRKNNDVLQKLNGGDDRDERTTNNEVCGTVEDFEGPPKKKKKKKKHIKEEVV